MATSTLIFDYLSERIRSALVPRQPVLVDRIFEPVDQGGMTFISLHALNANEFRAFVSAATEAQALATQDGTYSRFGSSWDELMEILTADARYAAPSDPADSELPT